MEPEPRSATERVDTITHLQDMIALLLQAYQLPNNTINDILDLVQEAEEKLMNEADARMIDQLAEAEHERAKLEDKWIAEPWDRTK